MTQVHRLLRIFIPHQSISRVSGIGWTADTSLSYRVYRPSTGTLGSLASAGNLLCLRGRSDAALFVLAMVT